MTSEHHARNLAAFLDKLAADGNPFSSDDWLKSARNSLNGAAALIRDLASNQLPDFDSIQPATPEPHAAEVVETWSKRVMGGYTGAAAAARLSLAAAWIKARDQEISQLRTALSRVQEPPQAFERDPALPHGFNGWSGLGEFLDARMHGEERPRVKVGPIRTVKLGRCLDACNSDGPAEEPAASDLQSQLAPLFSMFEQQSRAQAEHWRAMEHQTRRIADANALQALSSAAQFLNGARPYAIEAAQTIDARIIADALK